MVRESVVPVWINSIDEIGCSRTVFVLWRWRSDRAQLLQPGCPNERTLVDNDLGTTGHSGRRTTKLGDRHAPFQMICLALPACLPTVAAEDSRSYLCIADRATGFSYDKDAKKWGTARLNVEDMRYILKPDPSATASNRWGVYKFGEGDSDVHAHERWQIDFVVLGT